MTDDSDPRPDNPPVTPDPAADHSPDPSPDEGPEDGLDIDARFAEIIADWEPSTPEADGPPPVAPPAAPQQPAEPSADRLRGLFQPSWNDPLDSEASWEDEGHFVPPPPPPLPKVEPNRRLAWFGLVGSPLVALLLVGAGIQVTGWMAFLLVATFVGGFGYLVATMRSGPPDDWSGDDGARL
jgi:hypothetical protein